MRYDLIYISEILGKLFWAMDLAASLVVAIKFDIHDNFKFLHDMVFSMILVVMNSPKILYG